MTEKKIHWKTAKKLAEQNSEALSAEVETTQSEPVIEEVIVEAHKEVKQKGKIEWTVVYQEGGVDKEFTYRLSDTEDAYERALKVALKKGGKII